MLQPGIERRYIGRSACSEVTVPTARFWQPYKYFTSCLFSSLFWSRKIIVSISWLHVCTCTRAIFFGDKVRILVALFLAIKRNKMLHSTLWYQRVVRACVLVCVRESRIDVLNSKVGVLCFNWKLHGRETCLLIVRENRRFRMSERNVVKREHERKRVREHGACLRNLCACMCIVGWLNQKN
jgi:hypothetical protein